MKNKAFTMKPASEKQGHLTAMLKHCSGGALDDAMISSILPCVAIDRQYTVSAYDNIKEFQDAVSKDQSDSPVVFFLFSRAGQPPVATVLTAHGQEGSGKNYRAIYICAPNLNGQEGVAQ